MLTPVPAVFRYRLGAVSAMVAIAFIDRFHPQSFGPKLKWKLLSMAAGRSGTSGDCKYLAIVLWYT